MKLSMIPKIEKALGIRLYDEQVNYLVHDLGIHFGRRNGKTTAYCIRLALSEGPPIDLSQPWLYADEWENQHVDHRYYSKFCFVHTFLQIHRLLSAAGLETRLIADKNDRFRR